MASLKTNLGNTNKDPTKPGQQEQNLRLTVLMKNTNQNPAASVAQALHPLGSTQQCCNMLPGNCAENSLIVREALRMNLPHHLVLPNVQRRFQTHGANYSDLKDLVSDLFTPNSRSRSTGNQEIPMETNQLEEALMMNSVVAKKALQKGVPPHLIKPKVRAKILSNKVGYTDIDELLKDLNIN